MHLYGSLADDFYINMNLGTEMQLPATRETILGFFERLQKSYPSMKNFYTRENGDFVLEEDKDLGHQRWMSLETRRVCSGCVNPDNADEAFAQHELALQLIPYMLSVSPLDCEALDYMVGFDFSYRGNHDALVSEALGCGHALEGMLEMPGSQVLNYEPNITFSLDDECKIQARLMIETRTNAYQVKRDDFPEDQISVYFTIRQYGSLGPDHSFEQSLAKLRETSEELITEYVADQILIPLAHAIAAK